MGGVLEEGKGLEQYVLILKRFLGGCGRGAVEEHTQSRIHKITPLFPIASSVSQFFRFSSAAAVSSGGGWVGGWGGGCF